MMHLVIYGDFNCPYSALASYRASWLEVMQLATVEWRAVEHNPTIPRGGIPVIGDVLAELSEELEQVRQLLGPREVFPVHLPTVRPNTRLASDRYAAAATDGRQATRLRRRIVRSYWLQDADIDDEHVLDNLQLPPDPAPGLASSWQKAYRRLDRPITPSVVRPDGQVSRGLGALQHLAELMPSAVGPRSVRKTVSSTTHRQDQPCAVSPSFFSSSASLSH